jgi:hypothetical protein
MSQTSNLTAPAERAICQIGWEPVHLEHRTAGWRSGGGGYGAGRSRGGAGLRGAGSAPIPLLPILQRAGAEPEVVDITADGNG